jgi:hypothetical protein
MTTTTNFAELAIAAAAAEKEAAEHEQAAETARKRAAAQRAIYIKAQELGIEVDVEDLESEGYLNSVGIPLTADATLRIGVTWEFAPLPTVKVSVKPADQLYWDLPPGEEKFAGGGGVYGCYSLGQYSGLQDIKTTADIGRALMKINQAREQWRAKHLGESA